MHRILLLAGAATLALTVATPAAQAGFGAVAYDQDTGKYGASFNQATQAEAYEQALKQCDSGGCRVHVVEPKGCGALAMSDKDKAWGGADRMTLTEAKRDAVTHCQSHTKSGSCAVRISGCNQ